MAEVKKQGKVWLVDGQAVVTPKHHAILEAVKQEGHDPCEWLESSAWYNAMRKYQIKKGNFHYLCASEVLETREEKKGRREYRLRFPNYILISSEISKLLREAEVSVQPVPTELPRDKRGRIAWSQPAKLFNPEAPEGISGLQWALDLEDKGMARVDCARLLGVPAPSLSKVLANVRQRKKPGPTEPIELAKEPAPAAAVEVDLKERLERALAERAELRKQTVAKLTQIEAENKALRAQLAELEK